MSRENKEDILETAMNVKEAGENHISKVAEREESLVKSVENLLWWTVVWGIFPV